MHEDHTGQNLVIFFLCAAVFAGAVIFTPDAVVWVGIAMYHVLQFLVWALMAILLVGGFLGTLTSLIGWGTNWIAGKEFRLPYRILSIWTLSSLLAIILFMALYNYTFIGPWVSTIGRLW